MAVDPQMQRYIEQALLAGDTATILRRTETPNGKGGYSIAYADTGTWFKCRVRPRRGTLQIVANGVQLQQNTKYIIDYPRCVLDSAGGTDEPLIAGVVSGVGVYFTNEDRLSIGDRVYTCESVADLGTDYPAQQSTLWRKQ